MAARTTHAMKLSGYMPALPTPFTDDDKIDYAAFKRLCGLQIEHGASALVVCGTTGEAATLTVAEQAQLIRIAVAAARDRVPVVAGGGSNATEHAVELSREAEANGADAVLSVAPYYNKPTQDGLYAHFREIAAATSVPVILYDVPSRTARGIGDDTVARLAEVPGVIGLKDATGDIGRPLRLRTLVGADFILLSGDDASALGFMVQGGDGCISVVSNLVPSLCAAIAAAWQHGDVMRARQLMLAIAPLVAALFCETNPASLKYALSLCGLVSSKVRLPLVEISAQGRRAVGSALARLAAEYPDCMLDRAASATEPSRLVAAHEAGIFCPPP
jgi:4-hydroxy-tetrahydrodipicolinate synthase